MPVLNLGIRRSGYGVAQQPRSTPDNFGAQGFEALGELGKIAEKNQLEQDRLDIATKGAAMDVRFDELREEVRAEPDFTKRDALYQDKAAEYLKSTLDGVASPRVKQGLNQYYSVKFPQEALKTRIKNQLEFGEHRVAQTDVLANVMADKIVKTTDPNEAEGYKQLVRSQILQLSSGPYAPRRADQTQNMIEAFEKRVLSGAANTEIEADAPLFLRNLAAGKYDGLPSESRLALRRSANAAVSSAITIQKREQEVKVEAADREIQALFDRKAPSDLIDARLKELSSAGILGRTERKFWDDKLLRGEKADDAAQIRNAEKLKNDFLDAYPTPARIREFRDRKRQMERSGDLGDKGAAELGNMIIMAERSLNSEARAQRGEQRAIDAKADREGKMTAAQARDLIARNFTNANPNRPMLPGHKEDMQQLINRTILGDEDAGKVAKEIYTQRQAAKVADEKRKKDQVEAAKADPKAAEILNTLKGLKK